MQRSWARGNRFDDGGDSKVRRKVDSSMAMGNHKDGGKIRRGGPPFSLVWVSRSTRVASQHILHHLKLQQTTRHYQDLKSSLVVLVVLSRGGLVSISGTALVKMLTKYLKNRAKIHDPISSI